MSTPSPSPAPPSSRPADPTKKPSAANRYLFLFLLGLVVGIIGVVMAMRALDARKTWQDHYPGAAMHLMDAHMSQLGASVKANRCSATDILPDLKALRTIANDIEPAFPGLADDERFTKHASDFRAVLDGTLASPPLNCAGVGAALKKIGENCGACHKDFRS